MLKQFGTFIAWLSGSLAGITAGLYALGFIATVGSDQLLGIEHAFASRDPGFYVGRGGNLVLRTVLIAMWPVLALFALAAAIGWCSARLDLAGREALAPVRRVLEAGAAPAAVISMFLLALLGLDAILRPALSVDGLLYKTEIPAALCDDGADLRRAILSQDRAALNMSFDVLALGAGLLVGLGVIARPVLVAGRSVLWLAIAGIAGVLTLVGVPFAYGVLVVEVDPPVIEIDPPPDGDPGRLRLLSRSDGGLLVWLEDQRLVRWIGGGQIDAVTVGPGARIETLRCPNEK